MGELPHFPGRLDASQPWCGPGDPVVSPGAGFVPSARAVTDRQPTPPVRGAPVPVAGTQSGAPPNPEVPVFRVWLLALE